MGKGLRALPALAAPVPDLSRQCEQEAYRWACEVQFGFAQEKVRTQWCREDIPSASCTPNVLVLGF